MFSGRSKQRPEKETSLRTQKPHQLSLQEAGQPLPRGRKKKWGTEMLRTLPSGGLSQQSGENKTELGIPESQSAQSRDDLPAGQPSRLLPIFMLGFVCTLKPKFPFLPHAPDTLSS